MKDGKLQVAVVGAWHVHAKDYAAVIQARKDCTLAYVWDDDKTRGEEFAKAFSCTYIADYDALLAMDTLDAVIITSATDQHPALIVKAAQAKKAHLHGKGYGSYKRRMQTDYGQRRKKRRQILYQLSVAV